MAYDRLTQRGSRWGPLRDRNICTSTVSSWRPQLRTLRNGRSCRVTVRKCLAPAFGIQSPKAVSTEAFLETDVMYCGHQWRQTWASSLSAHKGFGTKSDQLGQDFLFFFFFFPTKTWRCGAVFALVSPHLVSGKYFILHMSSRRVLYFSRFSSASFFFNRVSWY